MDWLKVGAVVFGATSFWRLIDTIIKWRSDKGVKTAEARNFYALANKEIVQNWMLWSRTLENKIKDMEETITLQKGRIDELERHVQDLESRNKELEDQLNQLKHESGVN